MEKLESAHFGFLLIHRGKKLFCKMLAIHLQVRRWNQLHLFFRSQSFHYLEPSINILVFKILQCLSNWILILAGVLQTYQPLSNTVGHLDWMILQVVYFHPLHFLDIGNLFKMPDYRSSRREATPYTLQEKFIKEIISSSSKRKTHAAKWFGFQ